MNLKHIKMCVLVLLLVVAAGAVHSQNYPCSGRKGGVSHCEGKFFVCNDGTASQSKRNCSAENPRQYDPATPRKPPPDKRP